MHSRRFAVQKNNSLWFLCSLWFPKKSPKQSPNSAFPQSRNSPPPCFCRDSGIRRVRIRSACPVPHARDGMLVRVGPCGSSRCPNTAPNHQKTPVFSHFSPNLSIFTHFHPFSPVFRHFPATFVSIGVHSHPFTIQPHSLCFLCSLWFQNNRQNNRPFQHSRNHAIPLRPVSAATAASAESVSVRVGPCSSVRLFPLPQHRPKSPKNACFLSF